MIRQICVQIHGHDSVDAAAEHLSRNDSVDAAAEHLSRNAQPVTVDKLRTHKYVPDSDQGMTDSVK